MLQWRLELPAVVKQPHQVVYILEFVQHVGVGSSESLITVENFRRYNATKCIHIPKLRSGYPAVGIKTQHVSHAYHQVPPDLTVVVCSIDSLALIVLGRGIDETIFGKGSVRLFRGFIGLAAAIVATFDSVGMQDIGEFMHDNPATALLGFDILLVLRGHLPL